MWILSADLVSTTALLASPIISHLSWFEESFEHKCCRTPTVIISDSDICYIYIAFFCVHKAFYREDRCDGSHIAPERSPACFSYVFRCVCLFFPPQMESEQPVMTEGPFTGFPSPSSLSHWYQSRSRDMIPIRLLKLHMDQWTVCFFVRGEWFWNVFFFFKVSSFNWAFFKSLFLSQNICVYIL